MNSFHVVLVMWATLRFSTNCKQLDDGFADADHSRSVRQDCDRASNRERYV